MAKRKTLKTAPPSDNGDRAPVARDGEIARRAYDLFLARGCEHGHDLEDWLRAERELQGSEVVRAHAAS